MNFKQIIKQIGTATLSIVSAFGGAGLLLELMSSPIDHDFVPMLMLLAGLSGTSFLSGKYFLKLRKKTKLLKVNHSEESLAKEILGLAILNDGRITVSQVIFELNISIEKAKTNLEYLYEQGLLQAQVSSEGGISYQVLDLIENKQMNTSQNFID